MKHLTACATAGALAVGCIAAGALAPATAQPVRDGGLNPGQSKHAPAQVSGTRIWTQDIAPLATIGGVQVTGSAFGSSLVAKPGRTDVFYGLTDRGPNVDLPSGSKGEPLPDFTPAIGQFKLVNGRAVLQRTITLKAADGSPYNGQKSTLADTGETLEDLAGHALPASPNGYDPEGLVALADGTFWVSDEYGPFITHFDRTGRAIERLSPFDGSLPAELAERDPNKGMEGLTVTPDGRTLVGMMQAALNAPDGKKSKKVSALRIVTVDLASRATQQYVYVLHNTDGANTTVSEIAALNDHEFLVDERDGKLEPGANKKLLRISLAGATPVGKGSPVAGSTYDATRGGLLVGGRSVEAIAGTGNTAQTTAALAAAGITPVTSSLFLDVAGLVSSIDPRGGYFGHDKVEGVAVVDGGRRLVISNDSDFGIGGVTNESAPYQLAPKLLPDGRQDVGELLDVEMAKVPARFKG